MRAVGGANVESNVIITMFMFLVAVADVFLTWCFVSIAREVHDGKIWRKRRKDLAKSELTVGCGLVMPKRPAVASALLDRRKDRGGGRLAA